MVNNIDSDLPEKIIGKVKDVVLKKLDEKADELREEYYPKTFKGKAKKWIKDKFK
jgi:hypothetical protein